MIAQLPFTNDAAQTVTVTLDTGVFDFYVRWNQRQQVWCMSITNNTTQVALINNIPLLLGQDLLQPYDLSIGNFMVFAEDGIQLDAAFDDLGLRINVYYISDSELPS